MSKRGLTSQMSAPPQGGRQAILQAMHRLHDCEAEARLEMPDGMVLPAPPGSHYDRNVKAKKRLLTKLLQKELGKVKTFQF